jgi:non-ribosomal peptide synthase protein (TIGR01720 family)
LKYLTAKEHKEDIDIKLKPQIRFNYLGQLDAEMGQMFFGVAKEPVGHAQSLHGRRKYELEVSGMITGNRLRISIEYNNKQYKRGTVEALVHGYKKELCDIISFCCARGKREPTPCDFTYNKLSIGAVDTINMGIQGEIEDIYSLTPMQEWMLFYALYNEHSSAYFEQVSYRLCGGLDAGVAEKSINELFKRYDVLRAVFFHENLDSPVQVILKERQVEFLYGDICERFNSGAEKEAFVREFREKDRRRSFDLGRDVLMRAAVFRVDVSEYEFTWSHHHILMDGWCIGILIREFFEIYHSYMENRAPRLPVVNRFRDYIEWLENRDKEETETYWRNYLAGYEKLAGLPKIKARISSSLEYKSEAVWLALGKERTRRLDRLAAGNHVTLNTVLLAVWGILLAKYNDRRDVVFTSVVSGRPAELVGVEGMVGLFINTVPVRVRYEENTTFKRLLRRVQEEALASEPYHHISLAEIRARGRLKQHLADINVVFDNYPAERQLQAAAAGTFVVSDIEAFEQSEFNFGLLIASGDELIIRFFYNGSVYEKELVERIANQFDRIIQQVLDDEKINIEELTLLSQNEAIEISTELKKTGEDIHVEFDI